MNSYIKDESPSWSQCSTLEEWVRLALSERRDHEVVPILKALPNELKAKYREIWQEEKNKLNKGG